MDKEKQNNKRHYSKWFWIAGGILGVAIFVLLFDMEVSIRSRLGAILNQQQPQEQDDSKFKESVLPSKGITLAVQWGDLGKQMIENGVIDADIFESIYNQRGGLDENAKKLLYGRDNGNLSIDSQNAGFLLNLLWAFGLANKNRILEEGPMATYEGGARNFASTGGWSASKGEVMKHYSRHSFVVLTSEQQEIVEQMSKSIYRPCCGNSTYFPDCNHGMAMLGLLELMAAQGATKEEMYKAALQVNSYWFPDAYLTIARYFQKRGANWRKINPRDVLGSAYSSAFGYQQILAEAEPASTGRGSGCGV